MVSSKSENFELYNIILRIFNKLLNCFVRNLTIKEVVLFVPKMSIVVKEKFYLLTSLIFPSLPRLPLLLTIGENHLFEVSSSSGKGQSVENTHPL